LLHEAVRMNRPHLVQMLLNYKPPKDWQKRRGLQQLNNNNENAKVVQASAVTLNERHAVVLEYRNSVPVSCFDSILK
jgi:hypothetical protein